MGEGGRRVRGVWNDELYIEVCFSILVILFI